jgi:tRNA(Ser,Leu) C12 N-acetylase TAN1
LVLNPSIYVLGDQFVAVFMVEMEGDIAKVECLFENESIVDYTMEYNGPIEKRDEILEAVLKEAQKTINQHLQHVNR